MAKEIEMRVAFMVFEEVVFLGWVPSWMSAEALGHTAAMLTASYQREWGQA